MVKTVTYSDIFIVILKGTYHLLYLTLQKPYPLSAECDLDTDKIKSTLNIINM